MPTSFRGSLQLARHSPAATAAPIEQPPAHMLPPQLQRSPKVRSCMLVSCACGYIWVIICCSLALPYMQAWRMKHAPRFCQMSVPFTCSKKYWQHANCLPGCSLRCCHAGDTFGISCLHGRVRTDCGLRAVTRPGSQVYKHHAAPAPKTGSADASKWPMAES